MRNRKVLALTHCLRGRDFAENEIIALLAPNEKVFATAGHSVFHQAGTDADCCFIVEDAFY